MILASLAVSVQRTVIAHGRVLARVVEGHARALEELSVRAMVTPLILESLSASGERKDGPVPLNGAPVTFEIGGENWTFKVQDVAGLPSLLSTPLPVLEILLGPEVAQTAKIARERPADEVLTVKQALVDSAPLASPVSLNGFDSKLNFRTAPSGIVSAMRRLPRSQVMDSAAREAIVGWEFQRN